MMLLYHKYFILVINTSAVPCIKKFYQRLHWKQIEKAGEKYKNENLQK